METENKFQEIKSQLEEIKSSTNDENLINLILKLVEFKQETNDNDFYLDLFEDIVLKGKQQENMIIQNKKWNLF